MDEVFVVMSSDLSEKDIFEFFVKFSSPSFKWHVFKLLC